MYLIPRLIGIGTYCIVLFIFTFFFNHTDLKDRKILLILYVIILSIIAFNHIPPTGSDLYRLIPLMQIFTKKTFVELIKTMAKSNTPITILYYYILGKFNMDGILAGVTVFIVYSNLFWVLYKASEKFDISSKRFAMILFCLMSTGVYGGTIDNIRTTLALSIITVALYREFIEKKSITRDIPLYLVASLIHAMGMAVTIIRLGYLCLEKSDSLNKKIKKLFLFVACLFFGLYFGGTRVKNMFNKAMNYFTKGSYSYIWEIIIAFIHITLCAYILYIFAKRFDDFQEKHELKNVSNFIKLIIAISLVSLIFDYNTFYRLNLLVCMIMPILSTAVLAEKNMDITQKPINYNFIIITTYLMLCLSCARGSLCSLKFFI